MAKYLAMATLFSPTDNPTKNEDNTTENEDNPTENEDNPTENEDNPTENSDNPTKNKELSLLDRSPRASGRSSSPPNPPKTTEVVTTNQKDYLNIYSNQVMHSKYLRERKGEFCRTVLFSIRIN